MVSNPRGSRARHRSGRSLIRDCDRTPRDNRGRKDDSSTESNGEEPDGRKEDDDTGGGAKKKDEPPDFERKTETRLRYLLINDINYTFKIFSLINVLKSY